MEFNLSLLAGQPARPGAAGALFVLKSTGVASSIGVKLWRGTYPLEELTTATRGTKARVMDGGRFDQVELVSGVDCVVSFVVSDGAVDFDFVAGSVVSIGNTIGNPVPVTAVTVADTPATSAASGGPVACSAVSVVVAAASITRKELRIANIGLDPVAIGPPGLIWAQRCIVLQPGDMWVEQRGSNLAWVALTDVGGSASVTVQEVLV